MKLTIGEEYGDKTALLENKNGLILSLHAHGASIRKISVPDKNGTEIFFTMSYARESEYTSENHGNNGRTLAPNAGEVSEAEGIRFTNGDEVHPSANRGGNNLHGGFHRGSDTTWQISDFSAGEESACVTFTLTFADGLDGWEGNRFCSVRYTLDDTDTVRMDFEARSDKKTYINLSNHAYWNLETRPEDAMRQKLFIDAEGMYFNDEKSLPRKKIPPEEIYRRYGADFARINEISSLLTEDAGEYGEQIRLGGGLDNAFCLRRGRRTDEPACLLKSSDGKRSVELYTDAPDLVCYTAGGLVEGIPLLPKGKSIRRGAVALEAQEIPTLEPMRPLCPGETFHRFIAYHLKW